MAARTAAQTVRRACGILLLVGVGVARAQDNNYTVGPQDVLAIAVFEQADLANKYTVDVDGTVTFPMIGRVKVAGLNLRDIEQRLRAELSKGFFKNPQVSVVVDQYRSQRVFVMGEVRTPGSQALRGDMTLVEALTQAGGATEMASGDVLILRSKTGTRVERQLLDTEGGEVEVLTIGLKDVQSGRQNINLRDNDTINVTKAEFVYVDGQVRTPGRYPFQKGTTVRQALALAGGVTDRGASNRLKVSRVVTGDRKEQNAKLDDLVVADDTIYVPEKFF